MPDATIAAFLDHGTVARTVDADPEAARAALGALEEVGIDMADVARRWRTRGWRRSPSPSTSCSRALADKAAALG